MNGGWTALPSPDDAVLAPVLRHEPGGGERGRVGAGPGLLALRRRGQQVPRRHRRRSGTATSATAGRSSPRPRPRQIAAARGVQQLRPAGQQAGPGAGRTRGRARPDAGRARSSSRAAARRRWTPRPSSSAATGSPWASPRSRSWWSASGAYHGMARLRNEPGGHRAEPDRLRRACFPGCVRLSRSRCRGPGPPPRGARVGGGGLLRRAGDRSGRGASSRRRATGPRSSASAGSTTCCWWPTRSSPASAAWASGSARAAWASRPTSSWAPRA